MPVPCATQPIIAQPVFAGTCAIFTAISGGKSPSNKGGRSRARETGERKKDRGEKGTKGAKKKTNGRKKERTDRCGKKQQNEGEKKTKKSKREQNKDRQGNKQQNEGKSNKKRQKTRKKGQTKEKGANEMKAEQKARKQEQKGLTCLPMKIGGWKKSILFGMAYFQFFFCRAWIPTFQKISMDSQ